MVITNAFFFTDGMTPVVCLINSLAPVVTEAITYRQFKEAEQETNSEKRHLKDLRFK